MKKTEFHIFKRNTEAIATNRGFYYQYLVTIKLWLDNFVNEIDNEIYCEREDDIFEFNPKTNTYRFHQVKCYADGFGLNSPEIKSSLLNFFNLYLKYKANYNGLFYFETNAFLRPRAGKSLKKWYKKQQGGDYSPTEFIGETRIILSKLINTNLNKYIVEEIDQQKIKLAKTKVADFNKQLNSKHFENFTKMIRWEFSGEKDTQEAVLTLLQDVKSVISSGKLKYDKSINENLLLGLILNTVVEKSTTKDETQRLLNNSLLQKILNSTNLDNKIAEKLRPEVILLMNNNFEIINKLNKIEKTTDNTNKMVSEMHNLLLGENNKESLISNLTKQVKNWFKAIGYRFEMECKIEENQSEFIININNRRGYDRILILCVSETIEITHLEKLKQEVKIHNCLEGWAITYRRIDKSVKNKTGKEQYENLFCYTIDELLDENINFSGYFDWLENEVKSKQIDKNYIPLYCKKDVFEKEKNIRLDTSKYEIEKYIDQWLDDPAKKHISVLGEFGTGKTWFALHYAWIKLQEYKNTKERGIKQQRIPIVIPLRDFSKAVNIESVFSEFFFKKHNSPIPTYDAFVELNKMGKLLLIFDGFDEMADKVDAQKMINNFWELARTITDNSKVILTCRNEHFPEAKQGRELLNAELKASTQYLISEAPQFEVLELLKLNEKQIKNLLNLYTTKETVNKIIKNEALLDLARRPIMIELIIEALNDIEKGKPIDISRIYLYAVKEKFKKDIREERTFTSMPDKLFFMCELSWEMLSTDNMSINYRLFPDRIRELFSDAVKEQKDIDHWQYDMMGQTMLIRNDDGDYKPAHRSLLEFFVAYKLSAELGIIDDDFIEFASGEKSKKSKSMNYFWNDYFKNSDTFKLDTFKTVNLTELKNTFGKQILTRAVLDLMGNMISLNKIKTQNILNKIINQCRYKSFNEVGYIVSNLILLFVDNKSNYFENKDLSNLSITDFKLQQKEERNWNKKDYKEVLFNNTNFSNSDLSNSDFGNLSPFKNTIYSNIYKANFTKANLLKFEFYNLQINSLALLPSKNIIAIGSIDTIVIVSNKDLSVIKRLNASGWDVLFSPDGKYLVHSGHGWLYIRNTVNFDIEIEYKLSQQINTEAQEDGENLWTSGFVFSKDSKFIYFACNNSFAYVYNIEKKQEVKVFKNFEGAETISISFDESYLVCSEFNAFNLWDLKTDRNIKYERISKDKLNKYTAKFHPKQNVIIITDDNRIRFYDIKTEKYIFEKEIESIGDFCFSSDGKTIYTHNNYTLFIIDYRNKEIEQTYRVEILNTENKNSHESIERIVFNDNEDNVYLITNRQIVVFNLAAECIVDTFLLMHEMSETTFTKAKGIEDETIIQLKRNGAII